MLVCSRVLDTTRPRWDDAARGGPPMERHASRLSRRRFMAGVAGLGLVAGCGRLPWHGEQPKVSRIGVLSLGTADPSDGDNAAFRQGLRDLGYSEEHNITLDW